MNIPSIIQKGEVTDDGDPNSSAPTAARIHTIEPYADPEHRVPTGGILFRLRVKDNAGAKIASSTADVQLYVKDSASGIWFPIGRQHTVVPSDELREVFIPPGYGDHSIFARVTNVVGAGKTTVEIACGPMAAAGTFEKDGTQRSGIRPRGFAAGALNTLFPTGIMIITAGAQTIQGEDGVSAGSQTYPAGVIIPGPVTVTAGTAANFVGMK